MNLYYEVNYSDSKNHSTVKTIESENHRDAAKKYYQLLPRAIDCKIIVTSEEDLTPFSFTTSNLFPLKIKPGQKVIPKKKTRELKINPNFSIDKLDDYALRVFKNIEIYFPEWLPFVKNDWDDRFTIEIPSPLPDIPNLTISTACGEITNKEIELDFGFPPINTYLDLPQCRTIEEQLTIIDNYVTDIKEEKLIYTNYVRSRFCTSGGLITTEKLDELIREGRVRFKLTYSWKGTYNYKQEVNTKNKPKN